MTQSGSNGKDKNVSGQFSGKANEKTPSQKTQAVHGAMADVTSAQAGRDQYPQSQSGTNDNQRPSLLPGMSPQFTRAVQQEIDGLKERYDQFFDYYFTSEINDRPDIRDRNINVQLGGALKLVKTLNGMEDGDALDGTDLADAEERALLRQANVVRKLDTLVQDAIEKEGWVNGCIAVSYVAVNAEAFDDITFSVQGFTPNNPAPSQPKMQ